MLTWSACREGAQPKMGYAYLQSLGTFSEDRDWEIVRAKGGDNLKETVFLKQQGICHGDCDSTHETCPYTSQTKSQNGGGLKVGIKCHHWAEELRKGEPVFPHQFLPSASCLNHY